MRMLKILKFWFPPALYSGIIFYISSIPHLSVPLSGMNSDKVVHIMEYMLLGILVSRAFYNTIKRVCLQRVCLWTIILCFVYGISDEFHQSFVAGRDSSFFDLLADLVGSILGVYLYYRWIKNKKFNDSLER